MKAFTYNGKDFILDGEKIVIRSGAVHYFRVPEKYWYDRLLKLKECGFNFVETYVAWNVHEKEEGVFDFSGDNDLAEFLKIAQDLGLYAIVRPGPYICAEWEFGGFPYWLLKYDMKVRSSDPVYFAKLSRYINKVFDVLEPFLLDNGGNVVFMQVENEYGYYGDDKKYLDDLVSLYRTRTKACLLFTSDWPDAYSVNRGNAKGTIACGNFGSNVVENLKNLETVRPNQPLMCSEFWCGWFDHLYEAHHTREAKDVCDSLIPFFENGYSFNFYMFHGGTNFGFMNGANNDEKYQPIVTGYDYCALLSESGDRTPAYYGVRDVLKRYGVPVPELTAKESAKKAYGKIEFKEYALLSDVIKNYPVIKNKTPLSFEELNNGYGYVLYKTTVSCNGGELEITGLCDRANVFLGGVPVAVYERSTDYKNVIIPDLKNSEVAVLVENMGRANFGAKIFEKKGISAVKIGNKELSEWTMTAIPLDNVKDISYRPINYSCNSVCGRLPAFYKGILDITETADTFIKPVGFKKGVVFINGKNIGRFYNYGGEVKTLYVPAPFLNNGKNEIIVFDTDGVKSEGTAAAFAAEFTDKPVL